MTAKRFENRVAKKRAQKTWILSEIDKNQGEDLKIVWLRGKPVSTILDYLHIANDTEVYWEISLLKLN